jgi:hypothetical protein
VVATLVAKLSLSVAAFLLLGYCGRFHDRRVTGVLLTFPILNVIGLLSAGEPRRAADTICVVVIWNTLLFVAILTWLARGARRARSARRTDRRARAAVGRAVARRRGVATLLLGFAPPPRWLWLLALALGAGYALFGWRAASPAAAAAPRDRGRHRAQLRQFFDADLAKRLGLLVLAFAALATVVAAAALDSRWTGMLSAFSAARHLRAGDAVDAARRQRAAPDPRHGAGGSAAGDPVQRAVRRARARPARRSAALPAARKSLGRAVLARRRRAGVFGGAAHRRDARPPEAIACSARQREA